MKLPNAGDRVYIVPSILSSIEEFNAGNIEELSKLPVICKTVAEIDKAEHECFTTDGDVYYRWYNSPEEVKEEIERRIQSIKSDLLEQCELLDQWMKTLGIEANE